MVIEDELLQFINFTERGERENSLTLDCLLVTRADSKMEWIFLPIAIAFCPK